jgi:hypothetical protein
MSRPDDLTLQPCLKLDRKSFSDLEVSRLAMRRQKLTEPWLGNRYEKSLLFACRRKRDKELNKLTSCARPTNLKKIQQTG